MLRALKLEREVLLAVPTLPAFFLDGVGNHRRFRRVTFDAHFERCRRRRRCRLLERFGHDEGVSGITDPFERIVELGFDLVRKIHGGFVNGTGLWGRNADGDGSGFGVDDTFHDDRSVRGSC
uniref:(northern house mosquito) hypothetical protein n=1 Tax=Culex pipiens TaxID=7175 RepID=A0A8D8EWA7_CULPI